MNTLAMTLLVISVVVQIAAATIAIRGLQRSGEFRPAWISLSIALLLMVERRLVPLFQGPLDTWADLVNTLFGLSISLFILAGVFGLKRMFAHLLNQETVLQQLANTDYLTNLHNRRHFMMLANHELARAARYESEYSLMMVDIDWFKKVNDSYGHHGGDLVLQEIARICREQVRNVDIIGRVGGEEFAIFLPETGAEQAWDAAERLRQRIAQAAIPVDGQASPIHVTISIGVVTRRNHSVSLDRLLNFADHALYEAKAGGRNCVRSFTASPAPTDSVLISD